MNNKWIMASSTLLFMLGLSSASYAVCVYSGITATPEQGWFLCRNTCPAQITYTGNGLDCNAPHMQNYCNDHCADARDNTCKAETKNPINLSTGAKVQSEVDYRGSGHMPLEIVRRYNSYSTAVSSNWGTKWTGMGMPKVISTANNIDGDTYTYIDENGVRTLFKLIPNSGLQTTPVKSNTTTRLIYSNTDDPNIPQIWQILLPDGRELVFAFNVQEFIANKHYESRLLWKTGPNGGYHYYHTDAQNRIERVRNNNNQQLAYTYYADGSNRIRTITAPGNLVFTYEYDALGNLTKVIFPDKTASNPNDNPFKQYHYEDTRFPNHLTGISDENGDRFKTVAYDATGRAVLSELSGGAERMEVLEYGNNVRVRNAAGKETVYRFASAGTNAAKRLQLVGVDGQATSNCVASNTSTVYNANGFKDYEQDGRGYLVDYTYDSAGRETRRREGLVLVNNVKTQTADTRIIETDWDEYPSAFGPVFRVKELRAPGKTSQFTYENGRVKTLTEIDTTTHTQPYATNGRTRVWTYDYTYHDAQQQVLASVRKSGPRTDVSNATVQHFNASGLLIRAERISDGLTLTTQITEHHTNGLPRTLIDENNVQTTLTYHPRGWLETRTVATSQGNATTTYTYDNVGQVEKIRLPNGVELNYSYDAAHRKTAIYTNDGERIDYELDEFGNVRAERVTGSGQLRRLQEREFDDLGRLWKIIGVEQQELQVNGYDASGNLTTITNANQRAIVQSFDALNRLKTTTDRELGVVEYFYDGQHQLTGVKDQKGLTTHYKVDGFGRRIQQDSPDTGKTVYHYDLADNLTRKIDARNVETVYTYDGLNRLKTMNYPGSAGENVTYQYDETTTASFTNRGLGRLTGISEANGNRVQRIYNQLGLIVRELRTVHGQTYTTIYEHDLAGNLSQITYPSGRQVNYQFDANGRIRTVRTRKTSTGTWTNLASNIQYEPFGPVKAFIYGNGMAQTFGYDMHYRPQSIVSANGGAPVHSLGFEFNLNNELERLNDLVNPSRNQVFVYDHNDRLDQATGGFGQYDYQYDGVGNRLNQTRTGSSQNFVESYTYPSTNHRLQTVGATGSGGLNKSFNYTDAGNIRSDGTHTYDYNHRNRLVAVRQGATTVAQYSHNALGQRVQKIAAGATTHFHYDLSNRLIAESQGNGTMIRDYVYLGDQLLAMIDVDGGSQPGLADLTVELTGDNGKAIDQKDGTWLVTYIATLSNIGSATASDVLLANTFPENAVIESWVVPQGSCDASGNTCSLGSLAAGESLAVRLTVRKPSKPKEDFNACVSTTSEDSNMGNNCHKKAFGGSLGWFFLAALAVMAGLRKLSLRKTPVQPALLALGLMLGFGLSSESALADEIYYVHSDHLSTPVAVTNQDKQVVWKGERDPFGKTNEVVAQIRQPIRFPGQYHDTETGLHYNLMRDYHPGLGRYLQSDPIGLAGGINTYAYVSSNPITLVDPFGLAELVINGTNHGFVNGNQLTSILSSQSAGSISSMSLFNHGSSMTLNLTDGHIIYNNRLNGKIEIIDPASGQVLGDLESLLSGKFSENGSLEFRGCNTGQGTESLAQSASSALPGVSVSGFNTSAFHFAVGGLLFGGGTNFLGGSSTGTFFWFSTGNNGSVERY